MKVILLNAGIGKRLGELTKNNPKCLVKISETETILDHQLKNIIKCGITEFIMPTGPFEDQIINYIGKNYPNIKVQYVNNPLHDKTNYIYSIYLARDLIDDEVLYLHGDLIFSDNLLKLLLNSPDTDCALVNKEIPPPEKDFKAILKDDRICKIGVNLSGPEAAFLAPLYKLSKQFIQTWLQQIEKFINKDILNCYAEDALNEILDKIVLKPCYYNDFCAEIDDFEDLEEVRQYLNNINKK